MIKLESTMYTVDHVCCIICRSGWSTEGCKRVAVTESHVTCQCSHLTAFSAILPAAAFEVHGCTYIQSRTRSNMTLNVFMVVNLLQSYYTGDNHPPRRLHPPSLHIPSLCHHLSPSPGHTATPSHPQTPAESPQHNTQEPCLRFTPRLCYLHRWHRSNRSAWSLWGI